VGKSIELQNQFGMALNYKKSINYTLAQPK